MGQLPKRPVARLLPPNESEWADHRQSSAVPMWLYAPRPAILNAIQIVIVIA